MVRGRVHGVVVVCEVRVGAGLVVRGRVARAVPCAPLLGEVGDAARDLVRLDPRARTSSRRARGLSDVLADDQTRPHPNLADDHHAVNAPTNHHAPTSPAPHHTAPRSRTAVSGEKGLASGRRSDSYHRKCVIQLLGWSIAGLPAPGRHPFARGGVRDMLPSGRRADRLASAWLRGC